MEKALPTRTLQELQQRRRVPVKGRFFPFRDDAIVCIEETQPQRAKTCKEVPRTVVKGRCK